ncbi:death-associated protein 1-like [Acipenser oxyrinchus oxyrinchus]|uniref:Death-associated protein 1-like n=1 Tax=Acipenser oxyrinchus oxyrinchus TaxID=40147 RepID=A0AAD8D354_ACIOX|nr:death-associated protein 1-like [Acipenser oxyrinchus oxyrinchus]
MSSPPKDKSETKAGHPAAVKAGGMRIVQKHHLGGDQNHAKDKDSKELESSSPPKPILVISGAVTQGDKDFPPAASQVAHLKPQPCVEKLPPPHHINQHIHQPRK